MLFPLDNAIAVSQKAERCDYLLGETSKHHAELQELGNDVCQQKLELAAETFTIKQRLLEQAPTPTWILALTYAAGAGTVILGAWAANQVSK